MRRPSFRQGGEEFGQKSQEVLEEGMPTPPQAPHLVSIVT